MVKEADKNKIPQLPGEIWSFGNILIFWFILFSSIGAEFLWNNNLLTAWVFDDATDLKDKVDLTELYHFRYTQRKAILNA